MPDKAKLLQGGYGKRRVRRSIKRRRMAELPKEKVPSESSAFLFRSVKSGSFDGYNPNRSYGTNRRLK